MRLLSPTRFRAVAAVAAAALLLISTLTLEPGGAGASRRTATPAPAPSPCGATIYKSSGTPWTCSFADDFNGPALNQKVWIPQVTNGSGFTTGTPGAQACYLNSPNNVTQTGGNLVLTVREEATAFTCATSSLTGFSTRYTAGMVSTYGTFSQQYGRFEVRAKLPSTSAPGLQETLWLWPTNPTKYGAWPASGEIDFAEFYSQYSSLNIPYLHYVYDTWTASAQTSTNVPTAYNCTIDPTAFNTYAVEWLPGKITVFVNGNTCLVDNYSSTVGPPPAPFDQPFFPALTQALGQSTNALTADTPLPASTLVDYIHVWR